MMPSHRHLLRLFLAVASLLPGAFLHAENASANPHEAFLRGNLAYADQNFPAAEQAYRKAAQSTRSAAIHYNLANSLARQNKWAEAAAHYLKAHFLDPSLDAARANLLLAAEELGFDNAPFPNLPEPALFLPHHRWLLVGSAAFWIAVLFLFHQHLLPWRLPLHKTITAIAAITCLAAALAHFQYHRFGQWAVTGPEPAPLRLAPTSQSPAELTVPPGAPVLRLQSADSFLRVRLLDGAEGFLRPAELQPLLQD